MIIQKISKFMCVGGNCFSLLTSSTSCLKVQNTNSPLAHRFVVSSPVLWQNCSHILHKQIWNYPQDVQFV